MRARPLPTPPLPGGGVFVGRAGVARQHLSPPSPTLGAGGGWYVIQKFPPIALGKERVKVFVDGQNIPLCATS